MAYLPSSGSVVAFQSQPSSLLTGASIIGLTPVNVSNFPANQSISGTITTVSSGSIAAAIISGSIAVSVSSPANQSVSGTVGASVIGAVPMTQSGTWITSIVNTVPSSVLVGASIIGLPPVNITNFPSNQSVSGTVGASIIGQIPAGTAMIGSITAYQGAIPWTINSVYGNISGSVIAQVASSVLTVVTALQGASVSGTVGVTEQGTWIVSVAGTYAAGATSVVSGLGIQTLGLRNDSLSSVYGANGQYTPHTIGAVGEQVVAFAPFTAQVNGIGSCFTGVEQPIITSVAGNYIYVTGVQVANASANNVYLSFYGAGLGSVIGSIIGYSVVPANGGSNIVYNVPLKTGVGSPFSASVSGVASVFISAQGFYSKT